MNIRRKNPDEIMWAKFNFVVDANEVTGTTVESATVEATLITGTDPAPENLLDGPPLADTTVMQRLKGGVDGCRYKVRCLATLSDGSKVARVTYFDVAAP